MKYIIKYLAFSLLLVASSSGLRAQTGTRLSEKDKTMQKMLPSNRPMPTQEDYHKKIEAMREQARKNDERRKIEAAERARQQAPQAANKNQ